jgi:manganese efflux pump family protein
VEPDQRRGESPVTPVEVVLLALALSFDAFAVSLAAASSGRIVGGRATFRLSFHFGLFQFIMPVIGWAAGNSIAPFIAAFDHWIAFGLLVFIAIRMIHSALVHEVSESRRDPSKGLHLIALSVATSIDALAVGLTLGFLDINIWWPSLAIGMITGSVCVLAVIMGARLHVRFGRTAEIMGGVVLIAIALRILWTHLAS